MYTKTGESQKNLLLYYVRERGKINIPLKVPIIDTDVDIMLILITGGSGSGKSEYAECTAVKLKTGLDAKSLYYIAAMKPYGAEGAKRIERHRRQRAGKGFKTIENYTAAMPDISKDSVVLLECLSNLTANEIFDEKNERRGGLVCLYFRFTRKSS